LALILIVPSSNQEVDTDGVKYTAITSMVATLALLYFALDSILLENIFQFYTSIALHMLICAYVIWHKVSGVSLSSLYDRISLYVLIGVCVFQALYLALAWPVKDTFGWRLWKRIGGNRSLRPIYRTASIFFSLLKLDFVLGVLLVITAVWYLVANTTQIILNVIAIAATLGWLLLGYTLVQQERVSLLKYWLFFAILEPSYIIYKLIAMKLDEDKNNVDDQQEFPVFSWKQLLLTGCVAVVIRVACIIFGILSVRNFGKGLKEKMFTDPSEWRPTRSPENSVGQVHNPAPVFQVQSPESGYADGPVVIVQSQSQQQPQSNLRSYLQPLL
jgi:hypothetical protein